MPTQERSGGMTRNRPMATVTVALHLRADWSQDAIERGELSGSPVGGATVRVESDGGCPLTGTGIVEEAIRQLLHDLRGNQPTLLRE